MALLVKTLRPTEEGLYLHKININSFIKNPIKNFHELFNSRKINIFNLSIKNPSNFSINKPQYKNFSQKNTKLDPYLILEVNRGADFRAIKTAYFKLAKVYHPDANQNDEVNYNYFPKK